MTFKLADRIKETTTTTGTGAYTLAGAVTGFRAFSAFCANADTTHYCCEDGTNWEIGLGTWNTGNTLTRTTILASSNAGAAVNWGAGTKNIFCTATRATLGNIYQYGDYIDIVGHDEFFAKTRIRVQPISFTGGNELHMYQRTDLANSGELCIDVPAWDAGLPISIRSLANGTAQNSGLEISAGTGSTAGTATFSTTGLTLGNVTSINGGQLAGFRNKIINGNFDIWQRGTSFAGISNNATTYTTDRWMLYSANSGLTAAFTVAQETTDIPSGQGFGASLKISCTTAQGSLNASDSVALIHRIEGYNAKSLYGKSASLSFWLKTNLTGSYCVYLGNETRGYITTVTVSNTSWNKYTISLTIDTSSGTWLTTNGIGLTVAFKLLGGSSRNITANTWGTASTMASVSGSVNFASSNTNVLYIAGVQLEEGSVATPFEFRPYGTEWQLCLRYYEKAFKDGITPANETAATSGLSRNFGYFYDATQCEGVVTYTVEKRAQPTVTAYSIIATPTLTAGRWKAYEGASVRVSDGAPTISSQVKHFVYSLTATGATANSIALVYGFWAANAEL